MVVSSTQEEALRANALSLERLQNVARMPDAELERVPRGFSPADWQAVAAGVLGEPPLPPLPTRCR